MPSGPEFKPKIVGFLCNWCCYGGADLCGVSRFQYPPYLRVIRVMCSGRVDPSFVFRSLAKGADAIFIGGCHLNDCHYNPEGNYDALGMSHMCGKLLEHIGINPERLRLEWVSAGEGIRFAEIMNDFGSKVKKLGPLGSSENLDREQLEFRIEAVNALLPYLKMVERERLRVPERTEEAYHAYFKSDDFNSLFNELIIDKITLSQIMLLLKKQPLSTEEIARKLDMEFSEISRHLNSSTQKGQIKYDPQSKRYAITRDIEQTARQKQKKEIN